MMSTLLNRNKQKMNWRPVKIRLKRSNLSLKLSSRANTMKRKNQQRKVVLAKNEQNLISQINID